MQSWSLWFELAMQLLALQRMINHKVIEFSASSVFVTFLRDIFLPHPRIASIRQVRNSTIQNSAQWNKGRKLGSPCWFNAIITGTRDQGPDGQGSYPLLAAASALCFRTTRSTTFITFLRLHSQLNELLPFFWSPSTLHCQTSHSAIPSGVGAQEDMALHTLKRHTSLATSNKPLLESEYGGFKHGGSNSRSSNIYSSISMAFQREYGR